MIVPMKKIFLLVSSPAREKALHQLRKLGVIHISHLRRASSKESEKLQEEIQAIYKTIVYLPHHIDKSIKPLDKPVSEIAEEIRNLQKKKEGYLQHKEECLGQLAWFEEWGKISLKSLKEIRDSGIYINFYLTSESFLKKMPDDNDIFMIKKEKGLVYLVLITKDKNKTLNLKEEVLPDLEAEDLEKEIQKCDKEIELIETRFKVLSANRNQLEEYEKDLLKKLEFEQVKTGMAAEEGFCYLKGFAPRNTVDDIKKLAQENGWGYVIDEPSEEDDVPTLIKNPKLISIVEPVFKFMGTIPGYKEFDISFWFAIFFSLFVAILIGDAGYGCLFLGIAIIIHLKSKRVSSKKPIYLLYMLSIATIIWGSLSGTWFGFEELSRFPLLKSFIIPAIASFDAVSGFNDNQNLIMSMCLLIGSIHLTVAHMILLIRYINSFKVFAQLGWIMIIWGVYFLAELLILGRPMPDYGLLCLKAGIPLALFFSFTGKPSFKIFLSIINVTNLFPFILGIISAFADVVSYLRLFAVGYASVIVAYSFNNLAIGSGISGIGGGIKTVGVLVAGHALNIVLGLMALIVHGIRLNMLEFSGHLDMEWSGKEYEPFQERQIYS